MNPRKPTEKEKKQLIEFVLRGEDPEAYDLGKIDPERKTEIEGAVKDAAIAVFDNYITDSVGYAGKVMVVVWPIAPNYTQTYTWSSHGEKEYLEEEPFEKVGW